METFKPYQDRTTVVKLKGKDVKVHALCTGAVAVKRAFRSRKGIGPFSKLNILLDGTYTEYMPIWVWVIEHPEGTIIIYTGETVAAKDRKHYLAGESAWARYVSQNTSKFIIEETDSLIFKLSKIDIMPEDVKLVVLTHLHLDHTDGLKFFPKTEIIVGESEYRNPYSNLPTTYPAWFKPNLVSYKNNRIEVFNQAYPISSSSDLFYVPTPGHTGGHSSLIFKTDEFDIIFAGDASYIQQQVLTGDIAGVNYDYAKTKETYANLINYATRFKTIYLPSHDKNSANRLLNREFMI